MDTDHNQPKQGEPMQNSTPSSMPHIPQFQEAQEPRSMAPIIAIVALVIVAAIAAFYFWGEAIDSRQAAQAPEQNLLNIGISDPETDSIEQDLDSTDIENSDKELDDIDKDF